MSSRERYQYESASEYETEAEIDDWEVGTGKKGKKQYKKRRAFAETRKLQRWDADKDQLLLLVTDIVMAATGRPLPWDVIGKHISPNMSGESIKQHLTKVYHTRKDAGLPVPTKLPKPTQRKDHNVSDDLFAARADRAKVNELTDRDAGFVPRDADGRNFYPVGLNDAASLKNSGLLHLPPSAAKSGSKGEESPETPLQTPRKQVMVVASKTEPSRKQVMATMTPKAEPLPLVQRQAPPAISRLQIAEAVERQKAQMQAIENTNDVFHGTNGKKPITKNPSSKKRTAEKPLAKEPITKKPTITSQRGRKPKAEDQGDDGEDHGSPKKQKRGLRQKAHINYDEQPKPEANDVHFGGDVIITEDGGYGGQSMVGGEFGQMSTVPRTIRSERWPPQYDQYANFDMAGTEYHEHADAFERNQVVFPAFQQGVFEHAKANEHQRDTGETSIILGSPMLPNFGFASHHGLPAPTNIGSPEHYSYSTGNCTDHGQNSDSEFSGNNLAEITVAVPNSNSFSSEDSNFGGRDVPLPMFGYFDEPLGQVPSLTTGDSFPSSQDTVHNSQTAQDFAYNPDFGSLYGNPVHFGSGLGDILYPGLFPGNFGA